MRISYSNEKTFFNGDMEEVLLKMISAVEIRRIYECLFYKVKKATPRKMVKSEMVAELLDLEQSPEDFQLLVDTLPEKEFQAYKLLIWDDFIAVDKMQESLGFEIVRVEPARNKWSSDTFLVKDEFPFIGLFLNRSYYHGDRSPADYRASMPPATREWLKPYFPKPEGYDIQPLKDADIDGKNYAIFDASPTIAVDLSQLADFLKRSNPGRTMKGDFTKSSIRKAESLTESGDWYPEKSETPELALMRHTMLLDFIEGFEGKLIRHLTAQEIRESIFKDVFEALKKDETMLEKWLLGHLKHIYGYHEEDFDSSAISELFALFNRLPLNAWVSVENLQSMQFYRNIGICFYEPQRYKFKGIRGNVIESYANTYSLNRDNLQIIGINPLINGVAFLLSAFGFIQLAYKTPINQAFRTLKNPYITRFDGAYAVRLTDLGAYVFGLVSKLNLKTKVRKMATLRLHPEQLHVTCRNLDPVTELALKDFMEPVAPEFYRMTRASFLKDCQSFKDLKNRIVDFRNRIGVDLPKNWEQFLTSLETEKSVLSPENEFKIFNIADRPDLQRHFQQDAYLRKLSLRVEGHRVAIKQKNVFLVHTYLRKFGYFIES